MTTTLSCGPSPSLALPPIERLPSAEPSNVLETFLEERVRGWGAVPVRLSAVETSALWALFALNVALGGWLLAVHAGVAVCSGLVGTVVTLGGQPTLTLVLTAVCVVALVVAMPVTRGFTRAGGRAFTVVAAAGLCGAIALAGVVAVLVAAGLCLAVALGLLVVVVDRL